MQTNVPFCWGLLVLAITALGFSLSLHLLVLAPGVVIEDPYWQSFMEQAVRLIYFLAESPDQLCSRLLQRSSRLLLDQISEGGEINKDAGQTQDGSQESGEQGEQGECHCLGRHGHGVTCRSAPYFLLTTHMCVSLLQWTVCVWPSCWLCVAAWLSGRYLTLSAVWAPSCGGGEERQRRGRRRKRAHPAKLRWGCSNLYITPVQVDKTIPCDALEMESSRLIAARADVLVPLALSMTCRRVRPNWDYVPTFQDTQHQRFFFLVGSVEHDSTSLQNWEREHKSCLKQIKKE